MSREALAETAQVSPTTIVRLENYGQVPRVAAVAAIASVLGLSLDELFTERSA